MRTHSHGTGQAMIHIEATVEDVIRMVCNAPTQTYGYKLATAGTWSGSTPCLLGAMRLPSPTTDRWWASG